MVIATDNWITIRTLEAVSDRRTDWTVSPISDGKPVGGFFEVQDPFNLRKAIVPLLSIDSNLEVQGLGTAFGVSADGILYTADHVISDFRDRAPTIVQNDISPTLVVNENIALISFLGVGQVFGTVNVPDECLPMVVLCRSPTKDGDNPMAVLRGEPDIVYADAAILRTAPLSAELHTLRARLLPDKPEVGDQVLAIGFPEINALRSSRAELGTTLQERMFASYGHVTAIYPTGRDLLNQTPAFEIEAHLPSGMSGGPVFNSDGEVVGLISRSFEGTREIPGRGLVTWLGRLPEMAELLRGVMDYDA
jgi:serine protease Do